MLIKQWKLFFLSLSEPNLMAYTGHKKDAENRTQKQKKKRVGNIWKQPQVADVRWCHVKQNPGLVLPASPFARNRAADVLTASSSAACRGMFNS